MAISVLQRSSSFFGRYVQKAKTCVICIPFNLSTDSSERDDLEDFFGIPNSYKLQQRRMKQVEDLNLDLDPDPEIPFPGQNPQSVGSPDRSKLDSSTNLFDEQYFEGTLKIQQQGTRSRSNLESVSASVSDSTFNDTNSDVNFIEEQYFGGSHQTGNDFPSLTNIYGLSHVQQYPQNSSPDRNSLIESSNASRPTRSISSKTPSSNNATQITANHPLSNYTALKRIDVKQNNVSQPIDQHPRNKNRPHQIQQQKSVSISAHDIAVKVRHELRNKSLETVDSNYNNFVANFNITSTLESQEQEQDTGQSKKMDSKGYRVLSDQLIDLDNMTTSDILLMLKKKIIFDHEDFLAIDKPYGLPSLGNSSDRLSLNNLLPRLCKILPPKYNASHLHLVQGLDQDVTGAVILAKNEESAYLLKGMYNSSEIIQRFWAITKGVPKPNHGIVDIPIGEARVGNIYKMVLRPLYSNDLNFRRRTSKSHSYEAVTDFKVLASHQEAALVECQPLKKLIRHQIRVHLSNGLNTPILGDHKYSHFSKLAPQKLNRSTLELLHIRQAKARHIALHLHCHTLVIPHYKSQMIFIPTKLPPHFFRNMRSLKLSDKRHKK